jgi:hypothetical protein
MAIPAGMVKIPEIITILAANGLTLLTMAITTNEAALSTIATAGRKTGDITATFSPKFLGLFSEHLYPSPNKAFEELITNSWDADAGNVYVRVAGNLTAPNAAIYILDDGVSMNTQGLQQLWTIADSNKREETRPARKRIGKFGIGKLATYQLCNELTYICRYADGIIRVVTMDYRQIDGKRIAKEDSMVLSVRELDESELAKVLAAYETGSEVATLIAAGIPEIKLPATYVDEYGGTQPAPPAKKKSWTLAILTNLKEAGQHIEQGRTQYMLRTALPLGNTMKIQFNGTVIEPAKSTVPVKKRWTIGPKLPFSEIEVNGKAITLTTHDAPAPHIVIQDLGEVSGMVTLFEQSIAGGKSGMLEVSNGCFVNVLGRVVNVSGEGQFSIGESGRGTFAKFRATVRIDGLDKLMTIQRDALVEGPEVDIAKELLKKLFNLARNLEEKEDYARLEQASRVEKGKMDALPFNNVAAVLQAIDDAEHLPSFFNQAEPVSRAEIDAWLRETENGQKHTLEGFEAVDENPQEKLGVYDLPSRRIRLNQNHPYYKEYSQTKEQLSWLQDASAINLMSDVYLIDRGVDRKVVDDMIIYRDAVQRTVAKIRRNSPAHVIQLLKDWGTEAWPLEQIVGDALSILGFDVERLAKTGQPEGIATAFVTPKESRSLRKYTFNYDAKSTIHESVTTGNVHMAALQKHRQQYKCDYTLVVTPNYQKGGLEIEARNCQVTPMTTKAMGDLVALFMGYGPLNLSVLEEVFTIYEPAKVEEWVEKLKSSLKSQQHFDLGQLIQTLESLKAHEHRDVLTSSVIAKQYRDLRGKTDWPSADDVTMVLQGLSAMVPRSVSIDPGSEKVFLFTKPDLIMTELSRQAQGLPTEAKFGVLTTV